MKAFSCTKAMHHRLYEIRTALKLSQRAMASAMGYSNSFYSKIESHDDTKISLRTVMAICHTFNVRYEYLVDGEYPMFDEHAVQVRCVIEQFERLSEDSKGHLLSYLDYLAQKGQEEKK